MAKEKGSIDGMQVTSNQSEVNGTFDQEQMEKDLKALRKYGTGCSCYGCIGLDDEIQIKHPWFFGKYRERKAREQNEKIIRSREKTLVELKKILADYEERMGISENGSQ